MATYHQWRTAHEKGERKRSYAICGTEDYLRQEVIDTVRAATNAGAFDTEQVDASNPGAVWLAINTYPSLPDVERLVLVTHAERIRDWTQALEWQTSRTIPGVRVIYDFEAESLDAPEDETFAQVVKKAKYVKCSPLNEDHALAWLRWHAPVLTLNQAATVMARCGDPLTARDAARKLYLLAGTRPALPDNVVTTIAVPQAHGEFVAALMAGEKAQALVLAPTVPLEEYPNTIALLDSQVEVARRLREAQQVERGQRAMADLSRATGIPMVQVRAVSGVSRMYTDARAMQATVALAALDAAVRAGATEGVLEALVAAW